MTQDINKPNTENSTNSTNVSAVSPSANGTNNNTATRDTRRSPIHDASRNENRQNGGGEKQNATSSSGASHNHHSKKNHSKYNKKGKSGRHHHDGGKDEKYELEATELMEKSDNILHWSELKLKSAQSLLKIAEEWEIENASTMFKQDLIFAILHKEAELGGAIIADGVIELLSEGYGFLRAPETNYVACSEDIYVSPYHVKKYSLRTGDTISGVIRTPNKGEKYFAIAKINEINFCNPSVSRQRVRFENLTPIFPNEKLKLDFIDSKDEFNSTRIIDIIAPIGLGQRCLIVAPPRTGKTVLLQNIARAIRSSHQDAKLICMLVDERPEEVTDMARSIDGEVVSSTFDEPASRHVQLAEIILEKAKRLVEHGHNVVILLDSITRLARAYNTVVPSSGKVLTGGVDANALHKPKRFFGAARNIEHGGSLTIIGTALIDTGSKMDEVIFEEFKGTGNSEFVLDRRVSDKRIFPAMDVNKSGTRKEELLVDNSTLNKMWLLRRVLGSMMPVDAISFLREKMKFSKTNPEFFQQMSLPSSKNDED